MIVHGTPPLGQSPPPLSAWHGEEFQLTVQRKHVGSTLSFHTKPPLPEARFDPERGVFRYKPREGDESKRTLTFTESGGGEELNHEFALTVLPALESDFHILRSPGRMPEPHSAAYIQHTSKLVDTRRHNYQRRDVYERTVTGVTLVFDSKDDTNGLHQRYHESKSTLRLGIYADRVILRGRLWLPKTEVTVHARQLVFEDHGENHGENRGEDRGAIVTTPVFFHGGSGEDGEDGGAVTLRVKEVKAPDVEENSISRLVLTGAAGEKGTHAVPPTRGADLKPFKGFVWEWRTDRGPREIWVPADGSCARMRVYLQWVSRHKELREDTNPAGNWRVAIQPGMHPQGAGLPGTGGNGGDLCSRVDVAALAELRGGRSGAKGKSFHEKDYIGSPGPGACERETVIFREARKDPVVKELSRKPFSDYRKLRDFPAPAPRAPAGKDGSVKATTSTWLHPLGIHALLRFVTDAYVAEQVETVLPLMEEYFKDLGELSDPGVELSTQRSEIEALLHRQRNGLDYFGNPPGWVPLLSFQSNLALYAEQVKAAMPTLFLSYWVKNKHESNLSANRMITNAMRELKLSNKAMIERLKKTRAALPDLLEQVSSIQGELGTLKHELEELHRKLMAQAGTTIRVQNIVRFATHSAAALISIMPYGGPISSGLKLLADSDLTNPLKAASQLGQLLGNFSGEGLDTYLNELLNGLGGADISDPKKAKETASKITSTLGSKIGPVITSISKGLTGLQVSNKAVEAEFKRLLKAHKDYEPIVQGIKKINARKAAMGRRLAISLDALGTLPEQLSKNLLAMDALHQQRGRELRTLDPHALQYVESIGRRAHMEIVEFYYYLVRSYMYRMVRPLENPDYGMMGLFEQFRGLLEGREDGQLHEKDHDKLKAVLDEALRKVAVDMVRWFQSNKPDHDWTFTFDVDGEALEQLNDPTKRQVTLDLMERYQLPEDYESFRSMSFEVAEAKVVGQGHHTGTAVTKLRVSHSAESKIRFRRLGTKQRLFRFVEPSEGEFSSAFEAHTEDAEVLGERASSSQRAWGSVVDLRIDPPHNITHIRPSLADESLLKWLIKDERGEPADAVLHYRPGTWNDLTIYKTDIPSNKHFKLEKLRLRIKLSSRSNDKERVLRLRTSEGLEPHYLCTLDQNNRGDGHGDLFRVYNKNRQIKITAPAQHLGLAFQHFEDANGVRLSEEHTLSLRMDDHKRLVCVFAETPAKP